MDYIFVYESFKLIAKTLLSIDSIIKNSKENRQQFKMHNNHTKAEYEISPVESFKLLFYPKYLAGASSQ